MAKQGDGWLSCCLHVASVSLFFGASFLVFRSPSFSLPSSTSLSLSGGSLCLFTLCCSQL
jgi:hypothetical protein